MYYELTVQKPILMTNILNDERYLAVLAIGDARLAHVEQLNREKGTLLFEFENTRAEVPDELI